MSGFTTKEVSEFPNAAALWQGIVDASPLSGLWHTRAWHAYILSASATPTEYKSFFIYDGDAPVGLCVLLLQQREKDGVTLVEASYNTGLLPWPITASIEAEDFAFEELERRARASRASRIALQLYPETPIGNETARV